MRLFQYWDRPQPPVDVATWIAGFRDNNPEFEHHLFDRSRAIEFIMENYGDREADAFKACAVPAMQSDLFRLLIMDTFGGVYSDADHQSREPLRLFLTDEDSAVVLSWGKLVANGFFFFRRPAHPFVRACLALTIDNIEARRFSGAFLATGPGVLNAIVNIIDPSTQAATRLDIRRFANCESSYLELVEHARRLIYPTVELTSSWAGIRQVNAMAASRWVCGHEQPAYKRTDQRWESWKGDIYQRPLSTTKWPWPWPSLARTASG